MAEPSSLGARYAALVVDNPWKVLLVGALVFALLVPGGLFIVPNFTYTNFFYDDDPMRVVFDEFQERFGADSATAFVVHSPSGVFDEETVAVVQELTDEAWQLPYVVRVDSLANFQWVHADGPDLLVEDFLDGDRAWTAAELAERRAIALDHEMLPYWLVSPDAQTTMVITLPKPELDGGVNDPATITLAAQELAARFDGRGDHEVHIVGQMPLQWAFEEASIRDSVLLMPIVLLIALLFLVLAFRSFRGAVPPMVVMLVTVTCSTTVMGWLGVEVGSFTALIPQIMIAISLAGAVHVSSNFVAARRRGVEQNEAARFAIEKNFFPTLMMFTTSAVGFATFLTSPIANMADLGLVGAVGVMLAWVFVTLVLGPLIVLIPLPVTDAPATELDARPSQRSLEWASRLNRQRRPILAAFAVASMIGVGLASQIQVDSDPWNYFVEGYWCRDGNDFAIEKMDGNVVYEVVFDAGEEEGIKDPAFLGKVEEFERRIVAMEGVQQTISLVDIIKSMNRALKEGDPAAFRLPDTDAAVGQELLLYTLSLPQGMDLNRQLTVNNDAMRVSVVANFTGSTEHNAHGEEMLAIAEELGLDAIITGKLNLYQFMIHYVVISFVSSLTLAVILISICMGVFLRSPLLAMVAMVPNMVPLMVGGGVMYLLGKPLDIGTLAVGSVCLGISVDDTVHVMANFHRYVHKEGAERAVAYVLTHTAPALVTTTLMLVAAFGTLGFGIFVPNVWFGILVAVCLLIALFADLTALPALLLEVYKNETGEAKA